LDRYLPVGHAARDYDQSGHTYIMSGFFEELQRRKVYRVAAAYIVAAGFLIQIASATFPAWELPNWSLRLVIVLLLIGFPIALILAWAYDITPQGIQGTPTISGVRRRLKRTRGNCERLAHHLAPRAYQIVLAQWRANEGKSAALEVLGDHG
jgi:hypothetical protein